MKAAQLQAPRRWEIIEVDEPPAPNADQMLVRMERVAICGSDKPSYCGVHPAYPLAPGSTGHEGLGTVEICPGGKFKPGDRVLLWGFDRGLFQQRVLADTARRGCIGLPRDLAPEVVLFSQLLGTVIHSFYKLGNIIGQRVVVLGQGAVGQLFNATLRNLGAAQIIGVDPLDYRLDMARDMGATHTINPNSEDPVEAVARLTGGAMADLVVEAVGEAETFALLPKLARRNAHVICFGVPDKKDHTGVIPMPMLDIYRKELRLIASIGPNPMEDYTIALDWIVQGRLDVKPLISHVLPFERIQEGFEAAFDTPEGSRSFKVILSF
jgi:threonine dehydrogenase-like Zn-dependent dehydrogenase